MSKTGAIFFKLDYVDFNKYEGIIDGLSDQGWSTNKNGNVIFMVNESFEWQTAQFYDYPDVIDLIQASINNNLATCIDLIWINESASIGLNFINNKTIMISISEEIRMLGLLPVIDFSWY
jgi:hypothetical protein